MIMTYVLVDTIMEIMTQFKNIIINLSGKKTQHLLTDSSTLKTKRQFFVYQKTSSNIST